MKIKMNYTDKFGMALTTVGAGLSCYYFLTGNNALGTVSAAATGLGIFSFVKDRKSRYFPIYKARELMAD